MGVSYIVKGHAMGNDITEIRYADYAHLFGYTEATPAPNEVSMTIIHFRAMSVMTSFSAARRFCETATAASQGLLGLCALTAQLRPHYRRCLLVELPARWPCSMKAFVKLYAEGWCIRAITAIGMLERAGLTMSCQKHKLSKVRLKVSSKASLCSGGDTWVYAEEAHRQSPHREASPGPANLWSHRRPVQWSKAHPVHQCGRALPIGRCQQHQ